MFEFEIILIIIIIKFKIISIKKHEWRFCMGSIEPMSKAQARYHLGSR